MSPASGWEDKRLQGGKRIKASKTNREVDVSKQLGTSVPVLTLVKSPISWLDPSSLSSSFSMSVWQKDLDL